MRYSIAINLSAYVHALLYFAYIYIYIQWQRVRVETLFHTSAMCDDLIGEGECNFKIMNS